MARRNPFSNQSWEFTRGERNGIIVLVVLILLIIIVPTVIMKQYDRRQFKEQWEKDQAVMNRLDSMLTDTLRLEKRQRSEEYGRESTFPRKEGKKEIRVLDLNSATATDLEQLPGIGPVFAGRIVKYRERLGGYAHISQIKEVYGLPEETYHKIEPYIKCDPGKVLRLDVNTANEEILKNHPYISQTIARQIIGYREKIKPYAKPEDLKVLYNMTDSLFSKLSPYIYVSTPSESLP